MSTPESKTACRPQPSARVLVVDDSATVLSTTREALQQVGCIVETSDSIFVARLVNEFLPDVILIDVDMGRHSGSVAIKSLRHYTAARHATILLYSSKSHEQLMSIATSHQADGFICKLDGLDVTVREVMGFVRERQGAATN